MANVKQIRFGGTLPEKILFADGTECRRVYVGEEIVWNPNQYYLTLTPPAISADATQKTYTVQVDSYKNEDKEPIHYTVAAKETYDWVSFNDNTNVTSYEVKADSEYRNGANITPSASTVQGTVGRKGGEVTIDPFEFTYKNADRTAIFVYTQEESEDKRELSVTQEGGTGVGEYEFEEPSVSWLHVNGNTITVDENSDDVRSTSIYAVSKNNSSVRVLINITQDSASYELEIDPKIYKFPSNGGTNDVTVTSTKNDEPIGYTSTQKTPADWITRNGDSYTAKADNVARTGAIITPSITAINGSARSTGGEVSLDPFSFDFKNEDRGPVIFEYLQEDSPLEPREYKAYQEGGEGVDEYEITTNESWLSISDDKIIAEPIPAGQPERTGTATIKSKTDPTKTIAVTIRQVPKVFVLTITPPSYNFDKTGGEQPITVVSTVEVDGEVSDTPYSNPSETYDWITLTSNKCNASADTTERSGATIIPGNPVTVTLDSSNASTVDTSDVRFFTYTNTKRTASFTYKQTEDGGLTRVFEATQDGGTGISTNFHFAEASESWIKINGLTVTVDANESGADRTGTFVAIHDEDSSQKVPVTVTQPNAKYVFTINPESQTVTSSASNNTKVSVVSTKNDNPIGYNVSKKGTIDWVTFSDASNVTTYTVSADDKPRSGATITVSPASGQITGSVKSSGGEVNFDSFEFHYVNNERSGEFAYNQDSSNIPRTFTLTQEPGEGTDEYTFEENETWLSVSGGKVIAEAIPVGQSERTGTVTIKSKTDPTETITATIKQSPKVFKLEVSASPLSFNAAGGTCNATISSTIEVDGEVSDTPYSNPSETYDWITPTHSSKASTYIVKPDDTERSNAAINQGPDYEIEKGSAADSDIDMSGISFTFTNTDRTASFTYKQTETGGRTESIPITQEGGTGKSTKYTIERVEGDWITVSDDNSVSILKNETGSSRTGKVKATHQGDTSKIVFVTIKQKAEDIEFSVTPSNFEFPVAGGSTTANVISKINGSKVEYSITNKDEYPWLNVEDSDNITSFTVESNSVYKSGKTVVTPTSATVTGSCTSAGGTVTLTSTSLFTGNNAKNEGTINYTQAGGKATASFTATQPSSNIDVNDYTFSRKNASDTWLTINDKTITASVNGRDADRSAVIVATNKYDTSKKVEITVSQPKAKTPAMPKTKLDDYVFTINSKTSDTWNPTAAQQDKADGIVSKCNEYTCYDNGQWYLTTQDKVVAYSADKDTSAAGFAYAQNNKVYVSANIKGSARNSTITFTQNGRTDTVSLTVSQESDKVDQHTPTETIEYDLNVIPRSLSAFPLEGGSQDLSCDAVQRIIYKDVWVSGATDDYVPGDWTSIPNGFTPYIEPQDSWLTWSSDTNKATAANNGTGQERTGTISFEHNTYPTKVVVVDITQAGDEIETGSEYRIISGLTSNSLTIPCNTTTGIAKIYVQKRTYSYYKTSGTRIANSESAWSAYPSTKWTVSTNTNFSGVNGTSTVTSINGQNLNSTTTRTGSLTYTLSDLTPAAGMGSVTISITQNADEKGDQETRYRIKDTPTIETIDYLGNSVTATIYPEYQTYNVYKYGGNEYPNSESDWTDGNISEVTSSVASPFMSNSVTISASANRHKALPDLDDDYTITATGFVNFGYNGNTQRPSFTFTKTTTTERYAASDARTEEVTFTYHGVTAKASVKQDGEAGSLGIKGNPTTYTGSVASYKVTGDGFKEDERVGSWAVIATANPSSGTYSKTGTYTDYRMEGNNVSFVYGGESKRIDKTNYGTSYRKEIEREDQGSTRQGTVEYFSNDGGASTGPITLTQNAHPGGATRTSEREEIWLPTSIGTSFASGNGFTNQTRSGSTFISIYAAKNPAGPISTTESDFALSATPSTLTFAYSGGDNAPESFTYTKTETDTAAKGSSREQNITITDGQASCEITLSQEANPGGVVDVRTNQTDTGGTISSVSASGTGFFYFMGKGNYITAKTNASSTFTPTGTYNPNGYSLVGNDLLKFMALGQELPVSGTSYRTPLEKRDTTSSREGTATYTSNRGATCTVRLTQDGDTRQDTRDMESETYTPEAITVVSIDTGSTAFYKSPENNSFIGAIENRPDPKDVTDSETNHRITASNLTFPVDGGTKTPTVTGKYDVETTYPATFVRTGTATITDGMATDSINLSQYGMPSSKERTQTDVAYTPSLVSANITARTDIFSAGSNGAIVCAAADVIPVETGNFGNYSMSVSPLQSFGPDANGGYKDYTVTWKRAKEYKTKAVNAITDGKATVSDDKGATSNEFNLIRGGQAEGSSTYGIPENYLGRCNASVTGQSIPGHFTVALQETSGNNRIYRVTAPQAPDDGAYATSPTGYKNHRMTVSDFETFDVSGGTQSPTINYYKTPYFKRGTGTEPTGKLQIQDVKTDSPQYQNPFEAGVSQTPNPGTETYDGVEITDTTGTLKSYEISNTNFQKGGTNGVTAYGKGGTTSTKTYYRVVAGENQSITIGESKELVAGICSAGGSFYPSISSVSANVTYTPSQGDPVTKPLSQSGRDEEFITLISPWSSPTSSTEYSYTVNPSSGIITASGKPVVVNGVAAGSATINFTTTKTPSLPDWRTDSCTVTVTAESRNNVTFKAEGYINSSYPLKLYYVYGGTTVTQVGSLNFTSTGEESVSLPINSETWFIMRQQEDAGMLTSCKDNTYDSNLASGTQARARFDNTDGNVVTLNNAPNFNVYSIHIQYVGRSTWEGYTSAHYQAYFKCHESAYWPMTVKVNTIQMKKNDVTSDYGGIEGIATIPQGGTESNKIDFYFINPTFVNASGTLSLSDLAGVISSSTIGYEKVLTLNNIIPIFET